MKWEKHVQTYTFFSKVQSFFSFLLSKTGVGKLFGLDAFAGREHPYQITDEESDEGNGKQREDDKEGPQQKRTSHDGW